MVIEENEKANYLAHFKTKGAKNGIRRFQSYMVAPNPSGATGVEVGEAAEQRARIHGDSDDNQQQTYKSAKELRKEARRQKKLQKIAAKRKKKEQGDKEKWAKSYRELRKHSDAFTNEELRRAIERLELEDRITGASLNSVRDKTQKGADILKNLDSAGRSMAGIYNTVAGGLNVYHEITGKGQKLPKFRTGNESIQVKKPDDKNKNKQGNKDQKLDNKQHQNAYESAAGKSYYSIVSPEDRLKKKFKGRSVYHASLSDLGIHLEHHGVKGQSWFTRHFQSYKTAPTRSGKVGVEVGLAAKQAERNGEEEKPAAEHGPFVVMPKTLRQNDFKDTTPEWYSNYESTKGTRQYSKELDDPMNDNDKGIKKTVATINIDSNASEEAVNAAVDFAKNFRKHDEEIKDAIAKQYFDSDRNVPWLYQKDPDDPPGSLSQKVSNMSLEEQRKFFKDHLGTSCYDPSKTEKAFSTGHKDIMATYGDTAAVAYYSDGGAYWGHVFEIELDLKTGKVGYISVAG